MWKWIRPQQRTIRVWQVLVLVVFLGIWYVLTSPTLLPPFYFDNPTQAAFFFGEPQKVALRIWEWFTTGSSSLEIGTKDDTWFALRFPAEIWGHLIVTLIETVLSFLLGTFLGLAIGMWLALSPLSAALFDPYVKAANAMPRVILAPIFATWFGLGMGSKIALGMTLVFFIVFFNVYQGVREVSPVVLANARMLGASRAQLLRSVYLPSAMSWVFSSLHTSVGLAFVGAVVGEYLGSARGIGYLILQAEGTFDIDTVLAGIVVLTLFALLLDAAVGLVEKHLMKWQPRAGESERV
jgi:NitT/TauT family transport system permease protein